LAGGNNGQHLPVKVALTPKVVRFFWSLELAKGALVAAKSGAQMRSTNWKLTHGRKHV